MIRLFHSNFVLILIFSLLVVCSCRIFDVSFQHHWPKASVIGAFGHSNRGVLNVTVKYFVLEIPKELEKNVDKLSAMKKMGFVYKKVLSDNAAEQETFYRRTSSFCFTDHLGEFKYIDPLMRTPQVTDISAPGLYALFFYNC